VADKDSKAEVVETETIELRICLGRDMFQFVAVDPEGKELKGDDHRVCQF
jgi:hypothetical protein